MLVNVSLKSARLLATHFHSNYVHPANPYEILVSDGRVHDIEDNDYDRWCEYILYRGLYRTSFLRMSRGSITDTELQVGQFVVPKFGHSVVGEWGGEDERRDATESKDAKDRRYLRIRKEVLPVEHVSVHFLTAEQVRPDWFRGSGSQWSTMATSAKVARTGTSTMYSARRCTTIFPKMRSCKKREMCLADLNWDILMLVSSSIYRRRLLCRCHRLLHCCIRGQSTCLRADEKYNSFR